MFHSERSILVSDVLYGGFFLCKYIIHIVYAFSILFAGEDLALSVGSWNF